MTPELIEYAGWKNCLRLSNGIVELIATLDVGPRVIRLGYVNGQNLFAEFADQVGQTGGDEWKIYGGHRLWHAPEVEPRTYYPDNAPVQHAWDGRTLTLTPPPEISNRLQLAMEITLDQEQPVASINHRITNIGVWEVELAPWSLSVMAPGGHAVFPQERYIPHGESYAPARPLILWHFTDMSDPRWIWGEKYVQLRADSTPETKQKAGALNTEGWAAYLLNGVALIKRFPCIAGALYPDMGCNCEFFAMPGFLEVETLGPLTRIPPGKSVQHEENWMLARLDATTDEAELDKELRPLAAILLRRN